MEKTISDHLNSLTKATVDNPQDGSAWFALAEFLSETFENFGSTLAAYERAQHLFPNKDLRLSLGSAYLRHGQVEKGIDLMLASAAEKPRAEAYCFLADAYLGNGRRIDAERAARSAIQLEPLFEEGHYILGEILKDYDPANAIAAYRTAVSLDKNYALAWQALGRELLRNGNPEEGVQALAKSIALEPNDVWSQILLANGFWKIGRLMDARQHYEAAIKLAPTFPDLTRWYQEFLQKTGAFEGAI